jgi:hypothetical protein
MARFSIGGIASAAATATLPAVTLAGASTGGGRLRECGIFNTTATAFYASLRQFSTAGTRGAAVGSIKWGGTAGPAVALCTGADANTSTAPTLVAGTFRIAELPAAIGGGVIWTFGDTGLELPAGTANMFGILCPSGTGQVFTYYFDWDE